MANVTLLGASYSDVPAVTLPQTGGGTVTFHETIGSQTVTQNGTYDVTSLAQMVVNVSGGASNLVTGTFKGTTTGSVLEITTPYTGSGYPIAAIIFPVEGAANPDTGTFYSTVQRYAYQLVSTAKASADVAPTYEEAAGADTYITLIRYKSSSSSATTYAATSTQHNAARQRDPSGTNAYCLSFKSAKKLFVFIASNSYGFMANVEYRYIVAYSS